VEHEVRENALDTENANTKHTSGRQYSLNYWTSVDAQYHAMRQAELFLSTSKFDTILQFMMCDLIALDAAFNLQS
jgi:hypothetical protein